jgi:hypothetical protein
VSYPLRSRIRYRDQIDHPGIGVIEDYYLSDSGEEYLYLIHWHDTQKSAAQSAHFIEREFEVY